MFNNKNDFLDINYEDVEYLSKHRQWPNNQTPMWAIEVAEIYKVDPKSWQVFMFAAQYTICKLRRRINELEYELKKVNHEIS